MATRLVLNISQLHQPEYSFKDVSGDFFHWQKVSTWCKKWGQFQAVVVAKVDTVFMIVDGSTMVKVLKQMGYEVFECLDIGEMTHREYLIARLALTSRMPRLNYLHIAEAVTKVAKTMQEKGELATITHLKYDDIKNYSELLTFDWDAFLKIEVDKEQLKLFEDER